MDVTFAERWKREEGLLEKLTASPPQLPAVTASESEVAAFLHQHKLNEKEVEECVQRCLDSLPNGFAPQTVDSTAAVSREAVTSGIAIRRGLSAAKDKDDQVSQLLRRESLARLKSYVSKCASRRRQVEHFIAEQWLRNERPRLPPTKRRVANKHQTGDELHVAFLETKEMMISEMGRMQRAAETLVESSTVVNTFETTYSTYASHLQTAGALLSNLKRRAETDSTLIWRSFLFFCFVCSFIVLKRTSSLRIAIWSIIHAGKLLCWVIVLLCGAIRQLANELCRYVMSSWTTVVMTKQNFDHPPQTAYEEL